MLLKPVCRSNFTRPRASFVSAVITTLVTGLPQDILAQIPGVSEVCADRPSATGVSPFAATPQSATERASSSDRPASDLNCIDLFSTNQGAEATGVIELRRPWSPYGVTVTADGRHRHALTAWLGSLPNPSALGPYSAFVAWATPLALDPVVRLGEVTNGLNQLGEVAFNKYLVWITAEANGDVTERRGPLILRGRSPSSRMEAHDLMALAPSAEEGVRHIGPLSPNMDEQMGNSGNSWVLPPTYAGIPMLPGVMSARPSVSPMPLKTDASGLPEAIPSEVIQLPHGGTLDLEAGFVRKTVGNRELAMLAVNQQIPGPLLEVTEATRIFVNFRNKTPMPTAIHWHGLRLDNRYDGVPGVTQDPVLPGETFQYQLYFPDPGVYWYHPHHREDIQQELGLAGNMVVEPVERGYYNTVAHEEIVMLDDLLLGPEEFVPFGNESANYMLMGRFGNVFLTNGEPEYRLEVTAGDVVRFHFTNASNTRTFNLSFRPTSSDNKTPLPIKVVGSDVSRFERESLAESIVLAPAERYTVEVLFPEGGTWSLANRVQGINHRQGLFLEEETILGRVTVSGVNPDSAETPSRATPLSTNEAVSGTRAFETLRTHEDVVTDIDKYRHLFDAPPDLELVMSLKVENLPMVVEQSMNLDWVYFNPVEWTGTMPIMNWATSGNEVSWVLQDPSTGAENKDIDWRFQVGDVVRIRVTNDRSAFHAMQHPLHIHGQRFLVLEQNGVRNENMVWKDTVLLPAGSTTDILLELTNPGSWMVHCHIAEHLESGMKFVFDVEGTLE